MPPKTPEEIAAEEVAASKEQREQLARDANKKRNDALLEARNAIADSADEIKNEEDDLVPLTDDVWDQQDRPDNPARKSRAELIAEQDEEEEISEDEAAARLIREQEALDRDMDDARDAGAEDTRKNDKGVVEYKVGDEWLTLKQLRARAGDVSSEEDTGHKGEEGDKTPPTRTPSPEALQAQREAEEQARKEAKDARKAKLRDLYTRASMGDEQAIDELADMQADDSRVTPEALNRMVDERVDARVVGTTAFEKAKDWFESKDGFARELAAPGFKKKAAEIDYRLAQEHPEWSPRRRLEATGTELRKELRELQKFLGVKPDPTAGNGERTRENPKLERKRLASGADVPRAAGRARPETEPDEIESTQDAIAQMAKSRGQARPISHKH